VQLLLPSGRGVLHLPPWRGKVGMGGKRGFGTSPVFTPTLALPRQGGGDPLEALAAQLVP